ncbi:DUF167 domain-containing protein [Teichococcus aestuarii]|uniref:DUF167 domain-containing protein n=1 Tax=Teichococcus aestuarii TaxID=568898 RepID=UPI00362160C9
MELRVKAQPRARRPGLGGWADSATGPRLRLAVNAAPEDGRANRALCALLAEALHVPLPPSRWCRAPRRGKRPAASWATPPG